MISLRNFSALGSLILLAAMAQVCRAQAPLQRIRDANAHQWWIYIGDHPIRGPWGFYTEAQVRRADFGTQWQQLLLREAVTYRFSPSVQVASGYGSIRSARYGDFPSAQPAFEHRAWEQLTVRNDVKPLELEHRYRVEQRWLQNFNASGDYSWRYQNRFRYQFKANLPVGPRWYLTGGDELFIHFGGNHGASLFDQNRAFAGMGYKVSARNRLEVTYMNQFIVQRNGRVEESNHTLRLQWSSTTPFKQLFR